MYPSRWPRGKAEPHIAAGRPRQGQRRCWPGPPLLTPRRMLSRAVSPRHRMTEPCSSRPARATMPRPGPRSGDHGRVPGLLGLGAGGSGLSRRRMGMSLGTPVADCPPPVDAPFLIETDMAGNSRRDLVSQGLPFPRASLSGGRPASSSCGCWAAAAALPWNLSRPRPSGRTTRPACSPITAPRCTARTADAVALPASGLAASPRHLTIIIDHESGLP
jgi:hypothetical protein